MTPIFSQAVDVTRPHTLLTPDSEFSGSLKYRYDDDGQHVTVPNIWYNQTFQNRVRWIRYQAQLAEDAAVQLKRYGLYNSTPHVVKGLIEKHTARAESIRAEAKRIESLGLVTHPVAASHVKVEYSEVVGML